jgi:hypothetical protein
MFYALFAQTGTAAYRDRYHPLLVVWLTGMSLSFVNFVFESFERFAGMHGVFTFAAGDRVSHEYLRRKYRTQLTTVPRAQGSAASGGPSSPGSGTAADRDRAADEPAAVEEERLLHLGEPMAQWYSLAQTEILFDLLVSFKVFLGRFDTRELQSALQPQHQFDPSQTQSDYTDQNQNLDEGRSLAHEPIVSTANRPPRAAPAAPVSASRSLFFGAAPSSPSSGSHLAKSSTSSASSAASFQSDSDDSDDGDDEDDDDDELSMAELEAQETAAASALLAAAVARAAAVAARAADAAARVAGARAAAESNRMRALGVHDHLAHKDELWFDFMADCGDGSVSLNSLLLPDFSFVS